MLNPQIDPQTEIVVGRELIFGNTIPGSFHGFKFEDFDGDGSYDPNEGDIPQSGVGFQLTGTDGQGNFVQRTEFTDASGQFWFEGLLASIPGQGQATGYTITEIVPNGFIPTTEPIQRMFSLPSGQELAWQTGAAMLNPDDPQTEVVVGQQLIYGNTVPGSFHGFKFYDLDGDGIYEPGNGEAPLANVQFNLTGTDGLGNWISRTEFTNPNGEFWFVDLLPSVAGEGLGTGYTITEIVPAGFVSTTAPLARTFDLGSRQELVWRPGAAMLSPRDLQVEVLMDQDESGFDENLMWGNFRFGQIHGFKFNDLDGDGVQEPGEPRLAGFEIQLLNAGGAVIATEFTDANGEYWFLDLVPGTYFLQEVQQPGFQQTTHNPPPIAITRGEVYVALAGQSMLDPRDSRDEIIEKCLIFGNVLTASIHGIKIFDVNRNGINDGNDQPQPGVTFTLTTNTGATAVDAAGVPVGPQVTNEDGEFWYTNLLAGTYVVTETVPDGQIPTGGPISRTFTVNPGQELVAFAGQAMLVDGDNRVEVIVGVGLQWLNTTPPGAIHGYKFEDYDGDGIVDVGEPRLPGFQIQLLNTAGAVLATEVTNDNGEYWFVDLEPGTYLIREVQQPGYMQTTHDPQPITITVSEVYVAHAGLGMLGPDDPRVEIVEKCLIFGNQPTGEIEWRKETKTGLLGGVIFELTRTHSYSITTGLFTDILDEPITVVDNLLPDTNPTFGLFAVKDLELGRYTLRELIPVPGYDPDLFVETFEITYDDRFQDATHIFFNTWSKRAFVGSTVALRLAYLEQIGMAEATLNQQQLEQTALQTGTAAETEQFRVGINVGESSGSHNVVMLHAASGILIAEGELTDEFAVVTTDLAEHVKINSMPNHGGSLRIATAGGDDIIDVASSDFDSLDAGEGEDVLRVLADGTFDLTTVVNRLAGVEEIALAGEGEQQIRLDRASVNAASTNQPLRVRTQRSGQLNVDGSWKIAAPIRSGNDIVQVIRSGNSVVHIVNQMPFQNALNRFDVDGGGSATALDALQIINGIGRAEGQHSSENELSSKYFDVNGDGQWTALDALQVINSLYRNSAAAEGELVIASAPAAQDQAHNTAIAQYDRLDDQMQEFGTEKMIGEFVGAANATPSAFDAYGQSDSDNQDDEEFDSLLTILAGGLELVS